MAERIVVGMSGGVDSSVAAALLRRQGFDVIGVTMNVWPKQETQTAVVRSNRCCAAGAIDDARRVAATLGIPYYALNFRDVFQRTVIDNFATEYLAGRTPNPCIRCNKYVKFDALLRVARQFGAERVATGHYARVEWDAARGRWLLKRARDPGKDQSYVLAVLDQGQLARAVWPLGDLTKAETRRIAAELGLCVADKPESQEICFVPGRSYGEYLEQTVPAAVRPGPILDREGRQIGQHRGVAFYTIGQRKGLGVAAGRPLFVTRIDASTNTIVVGDAEALLSHACVAEDLNWIAIPALEGELQVQARIRSRAEEVAATIVPRPDGRATVRFHQPQRAVTPGQAIVFYDGDCVVGGGTIAAVPSEEEPGE